MKILHIVAAAITDKFYSVFFRHLYMKGYTQKVYIPFRPKDFTVEQPESIFNNFSTLEVDTILAPIKTNIDRFLYRRKICKYFQYVDSKINSENVSVIHAHSMFTDGGVAFILHKKYGIPYVISVRTTDTNIFMHYFKWLHSVGRTILENAAAIVFISHPIKKQTIEFLFSSGYTTFLENKTYVIPNGVDDYWIENILDTKKTINHNKCINLVQVSRLIRRKNVDKTILSVKSLIQHGLNCKLIIIGEGPNREYLVSLIRNYKLNHDVHMLGFVSQKSELLKIYRECDVFVMPSYGETFGISYLEAMTQRLPIIGVANTGVYGYFSEKPVGIFINKATPEEISRAVLNVVKNYEEYSDNSVNQVKAYNWEKICCQYDEIYKSILKGEK